MRTNTKLTNLKVMMASATLGLFLVCVQARAEKPIASEINVSDIDAGYLGSWNVTIKVEAANREIAFILNIVDVGGKVGATLDSATQPEPFAISSIQMVDGRMDMNSELTFGGRITLNININSVLEGDKLVGHVKDSNDLLKADFSATRLSVEELAALESNRPDPTEARLNIEGKRVRVIAAELEVGNSDWKLFENLQAGQVYAFTLSGATKMLTDFDLHFGDTTVKKENVVAGYPGVYSLWLKKTSDGWNLVFNSQPDIWGTLRVPEYDVAEVPLAVAKGTQPAQKYLVSIEKTDDGAVLKMAWGEYQWSAPFKIVQ